MRHGAFDYIEKPFNVDQLERLVAQAIRHGRLIKQETSGGSRGSPCRPPVMIGSSVQMQMLRARIAQVASTSETVLITGESGTGKELVARAIHAASDRSKKELVSLNCPVLSAQLMESELFGHERGAFTSADTQRIGRFESADGGTIMLDEISEIDPRLQAKLLRVLQERTFERVGSNQTIRVDVRVLATTNRNLHAEVMAGRFREDLYFRLAVVPLSVPPLRDRREDIPELVDYFFARCGERLQREPCTLHPPALQLLTEYHWPGNVRELENIVTRASILHAGQPIAADDLRRWLVAGPEGRETQAESVPIGISLQEMERKMIEATLERFGGHRAKTAEALGIGLRTLSGKLRQYGYAPREKTFSKAG
jgi:DNA-binding NtrC family response regulator